MTHGRQFGSRVIRWFRGLVRRLVSAMFVLMLAASVCIGYAVHHGWLQYELHVSDHPETSLPRSEAPVHGTGLGVTGRGRAYGIFVSLWSFPLGPTGEDRTLLGHRNLAYRVARSFIRARIMDEEDAIVLMDEQATFEEFRAAVARQRLRLTREDLLIVYFGTHGGMETLELFGGQRVTEAALHMQLATLRPGQGILIVDACHSGSHDWAMPGGTEANTVWHGLYSTGADAPSFGEVMTNALVELVPRLGRDDGDVTMEDLLLAVQERVRSRLPSSQREMEVNARGDSDAVLWRVRLTRTASRE